MLSLESQSNCLDHPFLDSFSHYFTQYPKSYEVQRVLPLLFPLIFCFWSCFRRVFLIMSMLFAEGSDHLLKTFIWVPIYSRWFIIFLILYTFFNSPLCNLAPFLLLTQSILMNSSGSSLSHTKPAAAFTKNWQLDQYIILPPKTLLQWCCTFILFLKSTALVFFHLT